MELRRRKCLCWVATIVWTLGIFCCISVARTIQELIRRVAGQSAFLLLTSCFVAVCAGSLLLVVLKERNGKLPIRLFWLAMLTTVYGCWMYSLRRNPEEALHFIQYGVLALLLFQALRVTRTDWSIYLVAGCVGGVIGISDEIVQWLTPNRVFDYRDILLNIGAGLLMLTGVALVLKPQALRSRPTPQALQLPLQLLALNLLMLLICLLNTPALMKFYTDHLPGLAYLRAKDNLMSEYGYRHHIAGLGVFYSRFRLEELSAMSARRATEAGEVLAQYRSPDRYNLFLGIYSVFSDPFLHELRVHLFRRDQYLAQALAPGNSQESFRFHSTVAYRENQFLEKYFGPVLKNSGTWLNPAQREGISSGLDPEFHYQSPVSANLITSFSPGQIGASLLVIVAGLLYWGQRLGRASR